MANFEIGLKKVKSLEFSSAENALGHNDGEDEYTFMGIYQKDHEDSIIWRELAKYQKLNKSLKDTSKLLYNDETALKAVREIYKKEYWDIAKLDEVENQEVANNIFIFGVNAGMRTSIKLIQKAINVSDDGIVGNITINAINKSNISVSDIKIKYVTYYSSLVNKNSKKYGEYLHGWINRVLAV